MRLADIVPESYLIEQILEEQRLEEAFLDSVKTFLGNKINDTVEVVRNSKEAMMVIFKVSSDPETCELVTFQLKKQLKQSLKTLQQNPALKNISSAISKLFPIGRKIKDFISSLLLVSICNSLLTLQKNILDQFIGHLMDQLQDWTKLLSMATSANGFFTVLQTLKVADALFFKTLTQINRKLQMAH